MSDPLRRDQQGDYVLLSVLNEPDGSALATGIVGVARREAEETQHGGCCECIRRQRITHVKNGGLAIKNLELPIT